MSSLLVCGLCPLPFENTRQSYGPGIRSWQFAHSLAGAGHEVHLLVMRIPGVYADGEGPAAEERDGVRIERLPGPGEPGHQRVRERVAELGARLDGLVGATIYGSYALASSGSALPLWVDQFGHVMAEAQAKAALERANWPLGHFWNMAEAVARRGDHFSVVSEPQRWACVGELGATGRLNAETAGHELVSVIPCAVGAQSSGLSTTGASARATTARARSQPAGLPADAFIALWSGGYNVWSDTATLLRGLELAMARCPRLHFVSTGAGIAGHDEQTYESFVAAVARSPFGSRMHLLGWLPAEEVPGLVASADVGVLTEKWLYEGQLGSKNRVLHWLGVGLPAVYNRVGELGDLLEREQIGLTFAAGAAEQLGERLSWAVENPASLASLAKRARDYAERTWSMAATTAPLVRWADAPRRSPDAAVAELAPAVPPNVSTTPVTARGWRQFFRLAG